MDGKGTQTTTDDVYVNGSLWDKWYGWGYLNLSSAALHATDVFDKVVPVPTQNNRIARFFIGQMFANEKATLTWNRHVAYNGPNYPSIVLGLSNFDLASYSYISGTMMSSSSSLIDNVEQVAAPSSGLAVLKVYSTGLFDQNVLTERFALSTPENFAQAVGPGALASWAKSPSSSYLAPFRITVKITNSGDLPIYGASAILANYVVVSGENPIDVGTILPGQTIPLNCKPPAAPSENFVSS